MSTLIQNDDPTLHNIIQNAIQNESRRNRVSLPGRVEKYDPATQKANIQPLLKKKYVKDDEIVNLPIVTSVPVFTPSGGNGSAFIHIPPAVGDTGILIFADRSMDKWLSGDGSIVDPDDTRYHHLSDGMFLTGIKPFGQALTGVNGTDVTLKNGNMTLTLFPDGKISLQGASEEFLGLIDELLDHLIAAKVVTMLGASPFTADTITNLTNIKTRLATLKK